MPTYAYRCESCGHQEDVWQKITDAHLTCCSHCEKQTFQRQLTAPNFQLKGSGWYVTDFRGNGNASDKNSSGTQKTDQAQQTSTQDSSQTSTGKSSASADNSASTSESSASTTSTTTSAAPSS